MVVLVKAVGSCSPDTEWVREYETRDDAERELRELIEIDPEFTKEYMFTILDGE